MDQKSAEEDQCILVLGSNCRRGLLKLGAARLKLQQKFVLQLFEFYARCSVIRFPRVAFHLGKTEYRRTENTHNCVLPLGKDVTVLEWYYSVVNKRAMILARWVSYPSRFCPLKNYLRDFCQKVLWLTSWKKCCSYFAMVCRTWSIWVRSSSVSRFMLSMFILSKVIKFTQKCLVNIWFPLITRGNKEAYCSYIFYALLHSCYVLYKVTASLLTIPDVPPS